MPYWRLSSFYFFFFASLGALVPYWSLYLQSLGYSASDIGELMAVIMATKMVAPNIWGWIADHTGRRVRIVRLGSLAAMVVFAGVFFGQGYWWLVLVMCGFSFFWHAVLPQFEATTLSQLGEDIHRYSRVRLWGSVGFILAVMVLGVLLDSLGTSIVPLVIFIMLVGVWVASLWMPKETAAQHESQVDPAIWSVLRRPEVIAVLVVCFLLQMSHGPYYTFYTIYLEAYDYSSSLIGPLWALGVLAEIGVFLVMHRLMPKYGPRMLLMVALLLTTLRWLMIAWGVEWLSILLFAQLLHAASFGVYHAVAIHLIHRFFTGRHQGRGQALYSSLSYGVGGALGSLASGYMWDGLGAAFTYSVAAAISLLAWVIAWRFIKVVH